MLVDLAQAAGHDKRLPNQRGLQLGDGVGRPGGAFEQNKLIGAQIVGSGDRSPQPPAITPKRPEGQGTRGISGSSSVRLPSKREDFRTQDGSW
jgi:hypothetical protein